MTRKLFALLVQREMDQEGLTITQFASRLRVSHVAVSRMLNGNPDAIVRRKTIFAYARAFGKAPDYFLLQAANHEAR